jgi:hypothetical protein
MQYRAGFCQGEGGFGELVGVHSMRCVWEEIVRKFLDICAFYLLPELSLPSLLLSLGTRIQFPLFSKYNTK